MSFTDDDLKQLKELMADPQASGFFTEEMMVGLLARLEAAELCARFLDAIPTQDRAPVEDDALKAWRKAAGK